MLLLLPMARDLCHGPIIMQISHFFAKWQSKQHLNITKQQHSRDWLAASPPHSKKISEPAYEGELAVRIAGVNAVCYFTIFSTLGSMVTGYLLLSSCNQAFSQAS